MFRNFYVKGNLGHKKDIVKNGDLACAFFTSFILHNFKLLDEPHLTVDGTQKDMEKSRWQMLDKPKPGAVIVWASREFDDGPHKHIGFCISNDRAISTDSQNGVVHKHDITFNGICEIESSWWHSLLGE